MWYWLYLNRTALANYLSLKRWALEALTITSNPLCTQDSADFGAVQPKTHWSILTSYHFSLTVHWHCIDAMASQFNIHSFALLFVHNSNYTENCNATISSSGFIQVKVILNHWTNLNTFINIYQPKLNWRVKSSKIGSLK